MRGGSHLRQFMEALATTREDAWEADHLQAAAQLMRDQKRRSLVVWITDLAETAMTPEVIDAASRLLPRHLVLFVVIGQPDLQIAAARRPANASEMFQVTAAREVIHRRELLLARMRERGRARGRSRIRRLGAAAGEFLSRRLNRRISFSG